MHEPYRKEWRFMVEKRMLEAERPVYAATCHEMGVVGVGHTEKLALKDLVSVLYSNLVEDHSQT